MIQSYPTLLDAGICWRKLGQHRKQHDILQPLNLHTMAKMRQSTLKLALYYGAGPEM